MEESSSCDLSGHIAVIGIAGEFPGSESLDALWNHLVEERELISFFDSPSETEASSFSYLVNHPNYVGAKGYLEHSCHFDNELFSYSQRESELMDPQSRRLLTWSWASLENAGYDPEQYSGLIGVFACSSISSYLFFNLYPQLQLTSGNGSDEMLMVMGCDKDFLATRISYQLNLKGPSKTIQTACSSSLVAVHDACQSLLNFECDMALAGGVSITFPEKKGYVYVRDGINSQDGHCRPFDASSSGTVSGNGGCLIVLKRANEAIRDGDTIRGFIRGSAINNDGREKIGFTAPSVKGQAKVIAQALSNAGIHPEQIAYVETHGTGTQLGDPIEIEALNQSYGNREDGNMPCPIGSVKANIGHLDAAAGIAGLAKSLLCLERRLIPPLLHFKSPNPKIDFSSSRFYPAREAISLKAKSGPLYAGVSSFGIGGTNAHVIIESAPKYQAQPESNEWDIVTFSALTKERLAVYILNFLECLPQCSYAFSDIAFTLRVGRRSLKSRAFFCARNKEELIEQLSSYSNTSRIDEHSQAPKQMVELGSRWINGETIQWQEVTFLRQGRRVPLPHYPFAKSTFFVEPLPYSTKQDRKQTSLEGLKFNQKIERIWCEILKVKSADPNDDFFSLGGDSLLALELAESLRNTFHVEIALGDLLEVPKLEQLQNRIAELLLKHADQLDGKQADELIELL